MSIIIDIKPELQAELRRRAADQGLDVSSYAASLLEQAAKLPATFKALTLTQLHETLEELAQFSHKIPLLPDEAFSRESLYGESD